MTVLQMKRGERVNRPNKTKCKVQIYRLSLSDGSHVEIYLYGQDIDTVKMSAMIDEVKMVLEAQCL